MKSLDYHIFYLNQKYIAIFKKRKNIFKKDENLFTNYPI